MARRWLFQQRWAVPPPSLRDSDSAAVPLNELDCPSDITIDSDGRVLVADAPNGRILRFCVGQADGEVAAGGRGPGDALNQLSQPLGIALDSDGHVLVADTGNYRILRFRVGQADGDIVA